jgi:hydrogenase-1 operon protein HyaF
MLQAPKEDMEESIKKLENILKDFENKGGKDYV